MVKKRIQDSSPYKRKKRGRPTMKWKTRAYFQGRRKCLKSGGFGQIRHNVQSQSTKETEGYELFTLSGKVFRTMQLCRPVGWSVDVFILFLWLAIYTQVCYAINANITHVVKLKRIAAAYLVAHVESRNYCRLRKRKNILFIYSP